MMKRNQKIFLVLVKNASDTKLTQANNHSHAIITKSSNKQFRAATLLKKRLWHRCFPVNFVEFVRTTFFTEHLRWLLQTVFTTKHAFPMLVLFQPFFLIIKGDFVTFGKIYLCVKSHSFILSLIPCCPLSFKTELWYLRLSLRPILQIR